MAPEHKTVAKIGLYSGKVGNYSLTIPVLVDDDGEELDTNVAFNRQKRNAQPLNLNYKLEIEGEQLVVQLFPNYDFISPNLVIERWMKNNRTRKYVRRNYYTDKTQEKTKEEGGTGRWKRNAIEPNTIDTECHYVGKVKGQLKSRVALSACNNGLAGVIVSEKHGEYWLEPVKENHSTEGSKQHIIFKRATVVPENKKKKRKKKRKHEKNCGTREPRRLKEMRLEWQQQPGQMKVQGRGRSRKNRWRRSVSKERYVEALIVADTSMIKFHQDTYVETYLLTIMNMVSALYQDPSIGNQVNIAVVNVILLDEEAHLDGLNITVNADKTLESFCKWQEQQNFEGDDHPNHHDVAILITREDICARSNTPCGTLGVAHVGGMCEKERSCNVNEDNGITVAHTITHELGHNFGMFHDTEKVGCSRRNGTTQHVMTPSFEADTVEIAWSPCSRRDITNFLDKGLGKCLNDKPTPDENYEYPELPPGAIYDASFQCQLQFGSKGMEVCTPLPEICSRLWCVVDGVCTTMLKPAAPGTVCGKNMWCINQQCVPISDKPDPIDGGWGEWGNWSECSRSCGAGVAIKERNCDFPTPAFGGKFCVGERRKYKICNTENCPDNTPSFRAVQCSSYDDKPFHGKKYKWIPYFDKAEPCELYCSDEKDTIIVPRGGAAKDGTPCRVGTRDMCIGGICKKVGCDWTVDSEAKEDKCGVCHGNGEQCDTILGFYNTTTGSGYTEVVTIPVGARNIFVEELKSSKNYIGIGSAASEKFYLNGKMEITLSGEYEVAGSIGLYEREKDVERIHIPGPLKEDIIVYIIYRGKFKNLGIQYNYTVPKLVPTTEREYEWHFSEWSICSVTCGSGHQVSFPVCKERIFGIVDDSKCEIDSKPDKKMKVYPLWWTGPWQLCPATCGDSSKIFRKRTVLCIEHIDEEPVVYTQPPGFRHHHGGGIEYLETDNKKRKVLKEYLEEELKNEEHVLKQFREEEIMALPDIQCRGQEKPPELEPCPNLPPCVSSTDLDFKSDGIVRFENGFSESEINCTEYSAIRNISCEWLKNLEKKGKKIRHELRKSNETLKILYNLNKDKKSLNRKNKKVKRRKKEKLKRVNKVGDIEELQNGLKIDQVYLKKSNSTASSNSSQTNSKNVNLLKSAKSKAMNYVYYKSDRRKHRH
ncbi:hypothetical protein RUM43_000388 [Polyplax serrata]|uniref:Peptidase M12B domain-containing protein n=1 Tax=Polyplax serrata TaxID=468196 RepID=A0AAN8SDY7_POLSC